ncbi:hypothetical protein ASG35_03070 [Burkholderia sp. Leaf177]|nr:hypothetical protein ASG35_03070 [Burkholderia sp. Leaf177]
MNKDLGQLNEVRAMLSRALSMVDGLIAQSPDRGTVGDVASYRTRPGGPLNERGVAEVLRRLNSGETDSKIALEMGISLVGAAKRRALWRRAKGL